MNKFSEYYIYKKFEIVCTLDAEICKQAHDFSKQPKKERRKSGPEFHRNKQKKDHKKSALHGTSTHIPSSQGKASLLYNLCFRS